MTLPTILERIVNQRKVRYGVATAFPEAFPFNESLSSFGSRERDKDKEAFIEGKDEKQGKARNAFTEGIGRRSGIAVIGEVKLGSPRLGSIAERVDPERMARLYAEGGAAALSVVVEPDFFGGSYELLKSCREASGLPAVAKDFVVSERQLDESVAAGADAVLLIAALYSDEQLRAWARAARARKLVPLIETHDREEIERLVSSQVGTKAEWELVGINNRDLRTFEVDLERSIALRPLLPAGAVAVAESGIASRADVERLAGAGFDALLVGEALLLARDPAAKLEELIG